MGCELTRACRLPLSAACPSPSCVTLARRLADAFGSAAALARRPRLQRFGAPQGEQWAQRHGQQHSNAQRNGGATGPTYTFAQSGSDERDWKLMSGAGGLRDERDRRSAEAKPWLAQTVSCSHIFARRFFDNFAGCRCRRRTTSTPGRPSRTSMRLSRSGRRTTSFVPTPGNVIKSTTIYPFWFHFMTPIPGAGMLSSSTLEERESLNELGQDLAQVFQFV